MHTVLVALKGRSRHAGGVRDIGDGDLRQVMLLDERMRKRLRIDLIHTRRVQLRVFRAEARTYPLERALLRRFVTTSSTN